MLVLYHNCAQLFWWCTVFDLPQMALGRFPYPMVRLFHCFFLSMSIKHVGSYWPVDDLNWSLNNHLWDKWFHLGCHSLFNCDWDSRTFRRCSLPIHLSQIKGEGLIGEQRCAMTVFLSSSSVDRFMISGEDNSCDSLLTEIPMLFYRKVMEALKRFW